MTPKQSSQKTDTQTERENGTNAIESDDHTDKAKEWNQNDRVRPHRQCERMAPFSRLTQTERRNDTKMVQSDQADSAKEWHQNDRIRR